MNNKKNLLKINKFLTDNNLLTSIQRVNYYFDEPQMFFYFTELNRKSKYFKNNVSKVSQEIYGSGSSFFDKETALIKCLGEAIERLCQQTFQPSNIIYKRFSEIQSPALDPAIHTETDEIRNKKIGWIQAYNVKTNKKWLAPAQYAHYTFTDIQKEETITTLISTGGALGLTKKQALLSGLYELIERDAFTTTYLIKAPVKKININSIHDEKIQIINKYLPKYLLEWHLFDISNDLQIPTYLSFIIDRTGVGQALSVGASSRLDHSEAILNSVTEACMTRPWARASLSNKNSIFAILNTDRKRIQQRIERAFYWFLPEKIQLVNFWLKKNPINININSEKYTISQQWEFLLKTIDTSNLYYCDITHDVLKKYGLYVYKVFDPYLNGLYLDENETRAAINPERLKQVADFFGIKNYTLNPIPHPFL
ncbi:MAG TPA: YcaO-like family protein [Candidatus Woesebacteria bacterium]|nr:YcaO-like family protein [Candidatus Woesebacteria bacterium]